VKRIILLLIVSLCILKSHPGDAKVWKGVNAFYNYEFNKSVKILEEAKNQFPTHPSVHFTWAVSKWLQSRAYEGIDKSYIVLSQSLDIIIPTYEKLVNEFSENQEIILYSASTHGLKARVHLGKKEWIGVIIEGIKGYRSIMDLNNNYPDYKDALFPIGVLNYFSGKMPGFTQFFAKMIGIDSDINLGIEQMKIAVKYGGFSEIEASQTLAYIFLWMDQNFDQARILSLKLKKQFPNSIYNQFMYTESLILLNKLSEAKHNLDLSYEIIKNLPNYTKIYWNPLLSYQKALIYFKTGDLDQSIDWVNDCIKNYSSELDTHLGYAILLRANIYDLKKNRELAVIDYNMVLKLDNYTTAIELSKKYLKHPYLYSNN